MVQQFGVLVPRADVPQKCSSTCSVLFAPPPRVSRQGAPHVCSPAPPRRFLRLGWRPQLLAGWESVALGALCWALLHTGACLVGEPLSLVPGKDHPWPWKDSREPPALTLLSDEDTGAQCINAPVTTTCRALSSVLGI